jgi:hypothetical protein
VYDPDAQAFFTAAGIINNTEKNAVNTLVLAMKAGGATLWNKMRAIYPFVGGNASSHLVNLKQPGTFNLTFYGGWSYPQSGGGVSLGAASNGSNAYADTGFNPSATGTNPQSMGYDFSLGVYSRTDVSLSVGAALTPFGAFQAGALASTLGFENPGGNKSIYTYITDNIFTAYNPAPAFTKFTVASRVNASSLKIFYDGVEQNSNTSTVTQPHPNINLFLGAANDSLTPNFFISMDFAFAFISSGLNNTDVTNLTNAVNAFQTALGRAV